MVVNKAMIAAALLDPSTKNEDYIVAYLENKGHSKKSFLKEIFEESNITLPEEINQDNQISNTTVNLFERSRLRALPKTLNDEIDKYLAVNGLGDKDVLEWWQLNAGQYKRLGIIAKKFLSIPVFSSDVESIFSIMGCIINARRSSLSPDKTEMLLFLHQNMDLI